MEIRNLGRSGLRVSAVGIGCHSFGGHVDDEAARKVIHKAIDLGITLFDTADIYGSKFDAAVIHGPKGEAEITMGKILGGRRREIVLATKFGMAFDEERGLKGASRRYIMTAVEGSLRRLKTDWIDLYQLHTPDPLTPIEETLRALDDLVRSGKVRYIGTSKMPAWQVVEALWTSKSRNLNAFASCQDEYSLVVRHIEKDLVPAMRAYGLGLLPFFPLASGLFTGKYRRGAAAPAGTRLAKIERLANRYMTERNFEIVEKLEAFAQARGHTLLELAFSWLAARPQVASVIAGATSAEQVEQNAKAISWKLTAEDMAEIDQLTGITG